MSFCFVILKLKKLNKKIKIKQNFKISKLKKPNPD